MPVIRIATRTSQLALTQANMIKHALSAVEPQLDFELVAIKTQGDIILDKSLAKIGGKGLFIKELQQALLEDRADIAVHSMKDVPYEQVEGLKIGAICEREDPRDVLVTANQGLASLPPGAIVGTSSLRRQMQLLNLRGDLICKPLRGNVPTRMEKCRQGEFDAIILAAAGLKRLNLSDDISEYLSIEDCVPAVGQGAIGIELRDTDQTLLELVKQINHEPTSICVKAERAMNTSLQGSCSVPLAGYAYIADNQVKMHGRIGWPDGSKVLKTFRQSSLEVAESLGYAVADDLIEQGAKDILDACR